MEYQMVYQMAYQMVDRAISVLNENSVSITNPKIKFFGI